jgi:DNA replication protein DnaC
VLTKISAFSLIISNVELAAAFCCWSKLLNRLAKIDLVVDDWMVPLTDAERKDFLEIREDRHGLKSTVIRSQYLVAKWHELIGEPTTADAILDRIVHNAHRITLKGGSMRKTKSNLTVSQQ